MQFNFDIQTHHLINLFEHILVTGRFAMMQWGHKDNAMESNQKGSQTNKGNKCLPI